MGKEIAVDKSARSIILMSSFVLEKESRRMAFLGMISNQVSTWLSHDEYVGVK